MNPLQRSFYNSGWFISKIEVTHDTTEYAVTLKRIGRIKSLIKKIWKTLIG